jgi:hypothetical protein
MQCAPSAQDDLLTEADSHMRIHIDFWLKLPEELVVRSFFKEASQSSAGTVLKLLIRA